MSRRHKPIPPKRVTLKNNDKLVKYLNDMLSYSTSAIKSATRHGISNSVNDLIRQTQQEVLNSGFSSLTARRHGSVPLVYGVRGFMVKNETAGVMHILGNYRGEDTGDYMLRFFEHGTKERITRNGSRGRLTGWFFFKKGTQNAEQLTYRNVEAAIDKAVEEINR